MFSMKYLLQDATSLTEDLFIATLCWLPEQVAKDWTKLVLPLLLGAQHHS